MPAVLPYDPCADAGGVPESILAHPQDVYDGIEKVGNAERVGRGILGPVGWWKKIY